MHLVPCDPVFSPQLLVVVGQKFSEIFSKHDRAVRRARAGPGIVAVSTGAVWGQQCVGFAPTGRGWGPLPGPDAGRADCAGLHVPRVRSRSARRSATVSKPGRSELRSSSRSQPRTFFSAEMTVEWLRPPK